MEARSVFSLHQFEPVHLVSRLSLLLMLFYTGHNWFSEIPLALLFICGFIFPDLPQKSQFWFAAFSVSFFEVIFFWHSADNHSYLITYWFLSLSTILAQPPQLREQLLRRHGLFYLSGCMLFAVLWKSTSSDFLSGDFFEFTLLTDNRFFYFTSYFTDISPSDLAKNQLTVHELFNNPSLSGQLVSSDTLRWLASNMAKFTLLIELFIPLSFLFVGSTKWRYLAHSSLLFFIFATYPVASVIGFAWLLILFAITQCDFKNDRLLVLTYCLMFAITHAFRMPYGKIGEILLNTN